MKRCILLSVVFLWIGFSAVACTSVRDSKRSSEDSAAPHKPKIRPYRPDMAEPAEEIRTPID